MGKYILLYNITLIDTSNSYLQTYSPAVKSEINTGTIRLDTCSKQTFIKNMNGRWQNTNCWVHLWHEQLKVTSKWNIIKWWVHMDKGFMNKPSTIQSIDYSHATIWVSCLWCKFLWIYTQFLHAGSQLVRLSSKLVQ